MFHLQPWVILAVVILGNCGFWLFCFNRINATGLSRRITKRLDKACMFLCFFIPFVIVCVEWQPLLNWLTGQSGDWWPGEAPWFNRYGAWCAACSIVLGALWLESRWWILPPRHLIETKAESFDVHKSVEGGSPGNRTTTFLNLLPGNEITKLQVTRKQLRLPRFVGGVDGLRIGHISDLHFTGQLRQPHYHYVIDRFMELEPELIVITGDIIDYDACLPWIKPILGRLSARYGCVFVLGNHDRRLQQVDRLTAQLSELGHVDLGQQNSELQIESGTRLQLLGNERPWFERHPSTEVPEFDRASPLADGLRIAVSHSPDQFSWARERHADLLLAGHTHGGQVRFPGMGPIVAPSWHGTKYASGVFYLPPTVMHVSRGVAGTHPLRWRCSPEVSLITLRA